MVRPCRADSRQWGDSEGPGDLAVSVSVQPQPDVYKGSLRAVRRARLWEMETACVPGHTAGCRRCGCGSHCQEASGGEQRLFLPGLTQQSQRPSLVLSEMEGGQGGGRLQVLPDWRPEARDPGGRSLDGDAL